MMKTFAFSLLLVVSAQPVLCATPVLQPSDWPVWGQNPANTRFNPNEFSVPPMNAIWSTGIAGVTTTDGSGPLGERYGIIVDGLVYGSYATGNKCVIERRNLLTSVLVSGNGLPQTVAGHYTYYPPSFAQGYLAFGLGGTNSPCTGGADIFRINLASGVVNTVFLSANPYLYGVRGIFGGIADQTTGFFYFSGFCPITGTLPVRTGAYNLTAPGFKTWSFAPPKPYKQFGTGDTLASFSPALAGGKVALALARPVGTCTFGTARIAVFDDTSGNDLCSFGPFGVNQFFDTPPALNSNYVYASNIDTLGVAAFDLAKCAGTLGNSGSCNLVSGSSGPNGRKQGFATDGTFVFVVAAGPFGTEVQIYNTDMSVLVDSKPWTDVLSPSVVVANGYIYCVEDGLANAGRPVAFGYDTATGAFTAVPPFVGSGGTTSPPTANGIAAVGEGVLLVSSPHLLRAYKLASAVSVTVITPTVCPPGPNNIFLSMDSAFDHVTNTLADARLMGLSFDNSNNIVGQFGMVYDSVTDTWNCFTPMPTPPAETCPAIYTSGISVVSKVETWAAGGAVGCFSGGDYFAWKLFPSTPPVWSAPMQGITPSTWNNSGGWPITMIRGVLGPQTGWVGIGGGAAFYDGISWSDPVTDTLGAGLFKISFPYADSVNGWAVVNPQAFAYLDTTFPAPGKWVVPNFAAQSANGSAFGIWVNAPDDVWGCGLNPSGTPMIFHSTAPAPAFPTPIVLPPFVGPEGNPANCPLMYDITFYELDPLHRRGVAVGGVPCAAPGLGPVVLVTEDHGVTWTSIPVAVPANYSLVHLRGVRFVNATTAYAWGHAYDSVTTLPIPLLVKVTL